MPFFYDFFFLMEPMSSNMKTIISWSKMTFVASSFWHFKYFLIFFLFQGPV